MSGIEWGVQAKGGILKQKEGQNPAAGIDVVFVHSINPMFQLDFGLENQYVHKVQALGGPLGRLRFHPVPSFSYPDLGLSFSGMAGARAETFLVRGGLRGELGVSIPISDFGTLRIFGGAEYGILPLQRELDTFWLGGISFTGREEERRPPSPPPPPVVAEPERTLPIFTPPEPAPPPAAEPPPPPPSDPTPFLTFIYKCYKEGGSFSQECFYSVIAPKGLLETLVKENHLKEIVEQIDQYFVKTGEKHLSEEWKNAEQNVLFITGNLIRCLLYAESKGLTEMGRKDFLEIWKLFGDPLPDPKLPGASEGFELFLNIHRVSGNTMQFQKDLFKDYGV